jgi:spore germination protein
MLRLNDRVMPVMVLPTLKAVHSARVGNYDTNNSAVQTGNYRALRVMDAKGYRVLDLSLSTLERKTGNINNFLRKAAEGYGPRGYFIPAPGTQHAAEQIGVLYEGHDYPAVGQIVDFIFFMTYNGDGQEAPPMAVSPISGS